MDNLILILVTVLLVLLFCVLLILIFGIGFFVGLVQENCRLKQKKSVQVKNEDNKEQLVQHKKEQRAWKNFIKYDGAAPGD